MGLWLLIQIRAKNDQTSIRTKPSRIVAKAKAIVTKAVTGKDTPDPKADELVETTVHDHDAAQAKAAIKGIVRSAVLMSAVSIYFGWNKMVGVLRALTPAHCAGDLAASGNVAACPVPAPCA